MCTKLNHFRSPLYSEWTAKDDKFVMAEIYCHTILYSLSVTTWFESGP